MTDCKDWQPLGWLAIAGPADGGARDIAHQSATPLLPWLLLRFSNVLIRLAISCGGIHLTRA
jgi:hypothetical protein